MGQRDSTLEHYGLNLGGSLGGLALMPSVPWAAGRHCEAAVYRPVRVLCLAADEEPLVNDEILMPTKRDSVEDDKDARW